MSSVYNDSSYPRPEPKPLGGEAVFNAEPYHPSGPPPNVPPQQKGWGCLGCFLGCLGVSLIAMILIGLGTWYAVRVANEKIPEFVREGIGKAVADSELNPDDKQMVMEQVDRLVDGYKDGRVDFQKLAQFGEDFMESPLMDLLIAFGARVQYIEKSGLSDEEKAEAEKILPRFARGVIDERISPDDVDVALNHISNEMPNGGRQFKEQVSDTELRAFLSECKRLADAAMVPDEEVQVDVGAELKKLVDKALGEVPEVQAPRTAPPKVVPELSPPAEAPPTAEAPDTNATAPN